MLAWDTAHGWKHWEEKHEKSRTGTVFVLPKDQTFLSSEHSPFSLKTSRHLPLFRACQKQLINTDQGWDVTSPALSSPAWKLGVLELAALKTLLFVPWLDIFSHYLASDVHSNSTGLNSSKIYSDIFSSIYVCFLHCHYSWAEHKLPEFDSWPRVQSTSPEIAFSVWDTTAKIAFLELNSYPVQDSYSTHISHHSILYYLGHLYFLALTVACYMLLCLFAVMLLPVFCKVTFRPSNNFKFKWPFWPQSKLHLIEICTKPLAFLGQKEELKDAQRKYYLV